MKKLARQAEVVEPGPAPQQMLEDVGVRVHVELDGQPARRVAVVVHVVGEDVMDLQLRSDGSLCDVAPTLLGILGVEKPGNMTGTDLRVAS